MAVRRASRLFCLLLAAVLALTGCAARDETQVASRFAPDEEHRLVIYTSHK